MAEEQLLRLSSESNLAPQFRMMAMPQQQQPVFDPEPQTSAVPLTHYLWILRRHLWKIAAFVVVSIVATFVVSSRLTRIYEATATVDVDRQAPSGIVGQDAQRLAAANDADQFLATQVKLIQSDSVLRPVTQKYNLLEHERQLDANSSIPIEAAKGAPVLLRNLKVSRPSNTYLLQISYRSPDAHLAADVANGIARSYLAHTYNIRIQSSANLSTFMEKQLEELRAKMERSSMALGQFERELNVINPEEKTGILAARLLQLNTEYTNAQADRVRKEAASNAGRNGSLEAAQVSSQGDALKRLSERLNEAQEKFVEVKGFFGANHPEYRKAAAQLAEVQRQFDSTRQNVGQRVEVEFIESANRERMLAKAVAETKAECDKLNSHSFEYKQLKNEAEADKKLYEELVRKIREAGINAGFQNSAVTLADEARPSVKPVFPRVGLNVLLAFLFSTILSVGIAVLSDTLDQTIRDPEQTARMLNTEVIGTLPVVKDRTSFSHLLSPPEPKATSAELVKSGTANAHIASGFEEAVRTLRNSILLADFDGRLKTILFTSSAPAEGKSTAALHLAISHAEQHKKTLLIDADLRRPTVHKNLHLDAGSRGLSNVLTGDAHIADVTIRSENTPSLHIIPAGPPNRRAADLIGQGMSDVLDQVSSEYDLVIIDGPPLLGFAETLQMASVVDGVVVIALAGQTNRKAIASVLSVLKRLRANVLGLVLNQVDGNSSSGYHYYSYYYTNAKYYRTSEASS
jgi:polysaccharide biosynthesis transport protein